MTIYEHNAGELIPQADRKVVTFDSGLVKVEQEFVCTTQSAETHRSTLAVGNSFPYDTTPAVDGLVIFPAAQETRTGDGFTKFSVSGFGRTTEQLISQRRGSMSTIITSSYYRPLGEGDVEPPIVFASGIQLAIVSSNSLQGKIAIIDEDGLLPSQLNLRTDFEEPVSITPVNLLDNIVETARTTKQRSVINWDGQSYTENFTEVEISKIFPTGDKLVGFFTFTTPKISIEFSTSYGRFCELGISVNNSLQLKTYTAEDLS
jgi:hypothetical protein